MNAWQTIYYSNNRSDKVVMEEIVSFGTKASGKIFGRIDLLNRYGTDLSGKHIKHALGKLWELRIDHYRVLYFAIKDRNFVILRCFLKKTDKTPDKEIRLTLNRLNDYISRGETKK